MSLPVGQSWTGWDEFMSLVPPYAAVFLHPHNALPSCHRPTGRRPWYGFDPRQFYPDLNKRPMTSIWPWLVLVGLGAFHGLNPAMGWLFAVALGIHRQSRRVLLVSLLPIALGHAIAIAIVVYSVMVLGFAIGTGRTRRHLRPTADRLGHLSRSPRISSSGERRSSDRVRRAHHLVFSHGNGAWRGAYAHPRVVTPATPLGTHPWIDPVRLDHDL